jgi:hypothetical protein
VIKANQPWWCRFGSPRHSLKLSLESRCKAVLRRSGRRILGRIETLVGRKICRPPHLKDPRKAWLTKQRESHLSSGLEPALIRISKETVLRFTFFLALRNRSPSVRLANELRDPDLVARRAIPLFHHRPCSASATTLANATDLTSISGAS